MEDIFKKSHSVLKQGKTFVLDRLSSLCQALASSPGILFYQAAPCLVTQRFIFTKVTAPPTVPSKGAEELTGDEASQALLSCLAYQLGTNPCTDKSSYRPPLPSKVKSTYPRSLPSKAKSSYYPPPLKSQIVLPRRLPSKVKSFYPRPLPSKVKSSYYPPLLKSQIVLPPPPPLKSQIVLSRAPSLKSQIVLPPLPLPSPQKSNRPSLFVKPAYDKKL